MKRKTGGVVCALVAAALWAPAAGFAKPAPKKGHKVAPTLHLCAWMIAAGAGSLELEGSCRETHGHPKTFHTPLGSYTSTLYTASWRAEHPTLELVPHHMLSVGVAHVTGSSAVISYFQKHERAKVLANGVLVANSKGLLATWAGDTYSCKNPPTGDCTTSEFESTKGNWGVVLADTGAPPGSPGAEEENSGEDDPQDLAQEELLKPATVGIGMAITGKV
jgi:hypothetical protein